LRDKVTIVYQIRDSEDKDSLINRYMTILTVHKRQNRSPEI